jgi:putative transposase
MLRQHDPVRQVCRVLSATRRSSYDQAQGRDETPLKAAIERLAGAWPTDGDRRITVLLSRAGFQVNHQHVARLRREMALPGQRPARGPRATQSAHAYPRDPHLVQGLTLRHPDHVGVSDLTDVHVRAAFVSLAVLMDVDTRRIRGWHVSRHLDQALTLTALRRGLAQHQPAIHHSDQGGPYAAPADGHLWEHAQVQLSLATVGEPTENGDAERLMRTLKEAEVTLQDYADFHAAYRHLGRVLDPIYQHTRIHAALGSLTPAEFATPWRPQQAAAASVK